MIGDGSNDCPVISQANLGVSFAKTPATLSAGFIFSGDSISCVEAIICSGK